MVAVNVHTAENGLEIAYPTQLDDPQYLEVFVSPPGQMSGLDGVTLDDLTPEQIKMTISKLNMPISYNNGKVRISDPLRSKLSERPLLRHIVQKIEESTFATRGNQNEQ